MILIIDNYDSFTHNLYQRIAMLHADVRVIRNDKLTISDVFKMNPHGIVLSPGPGRPEHAGICVPLIKALAEEIQTIPLLGVCLGHQALGLALGAKIIATPEICHGKSDMVYHNQTGLYQNYSSPFQAGRYHSLIVDSKTLPESLIIEAENSQKLIMGMRHRERPLFGVQFHPESILTPEGFRLLDNFVSLCLPIHEVAA